MKGNRKSKNRGTEKQAKIWMLGVPEEEAKTKGITTKTTTKD